MLAAYISSPAAFSPSAERATYSACPSVPPQRHHKADSAVGLPPATSAQRFCLTL